MKAERTMHHARELRDDYGSSSARRRRFTRWAKRQLARATRRFHNTDPVAWS